MRVSYLSTFPVGFVKNQIANRNSTSKHATRIHTSFYIATSSESSASVLLLLTFFFAYNLDHHNSTLVYVQAFEILFFSPQRLSYKSKIHDCTRLGHMGHLACVGRDHGFTVSSHRLENKTIVSVRLPFVYVEFVTKYVL